MLWLIVKYARENLLIVAVIGGLSMFLGKRWADLVFFCYGTVTVLAFMYAKSLGWQTPSQSPLTKLSKKFQGENGFGSILLWVILPVFYLSIFLGWVIGKFWR